MTSSSRGAACWLPLVLSGCAPSTLVAATRVVDADAAAFSSTAVCFVPPSAAASSSERAEQIRILEICRVAAQAQGVRVVAFGTEACLAASMSWARQGTGDDEEKCVYPLHSGDCQQSGVQLQSLKVVLTRPGDGTRVSETTATSLSNSDRFSSDSYQALCTAAFHEYPHPLSDAELDVPVR